MHGALHLDPPHALPRGFTFVTAGKKRETLTGDATVRFYDHLEASAAWHSAHTCMHMPTARICLACPVWYIAFTPISP